MRWVIAAGAAIVAGVVLGVVAGHLILELLDGEWEVPF